MLLRQFKAAEDLLAPYAPGTKVLVGSIKIYNFLYIYYCLILYFEIIVLAFLSIFFLLISPYQNLYKQQYFKIYNFLYFLLIFTFYNYN